MKKTNIRLLATFAMLATAVLPGWADLIVETDFQRKMPVAFSGYAGTSSLTNFPALVKFDTSIDGFSYDLFAEGGVNLRFTDAAGNLLAYEIDTWNTSGTSLIWVKIPELAATTQITAYWGSDSTQHAASQTDGSVWGAATYAGVWHLNEAGTTSADATANNLDGSNGSTTYVAAGKLGAARQISNGAKQDKDGLGIVVPNYNSLGVGNSFTVSTWLKYKAGQTPGYDRIIGRKTAYNDSNGWEITLRDGSTTLLDHRGANGDSQQSTVFGNVADGNWQFLTVVYDGTTSRAYLDGTWKSTKNIVAAATDNNKTLTLGNNQAKTETTLKGTLDEMRLRDAVSSSDWIAAEYATVANASFAAYGTIEPIVADLPALGVSTAADVDFHSADLTYTVTRLGTSNPDILIAYGTSAEDLAQTNFVAAGVSATGTYEHTLAGLLCSTTYYARHLATNASGAAQSGVFSFTTPGDPALGTASITATGTTLDITGSLTDIGVSNATVELWFGTDAETLSVIETWPDLSAPQSFSKTLSSQPFGTYYCRFRAVNVCNGATNEVWTTIASDTIFGTCTWDGSAGDGSWNNPANWDSGTVPGFKDTAVFTDNGTGGSPTLKLNAGQRVFKLVIQTINPFTIGNADDVTADFALGLTDLERQDVDGTEGLHAFGAPVVLHPDANGRSTWTINGSDVVRMNGKLKSSSATTYVKMGAGTFNMNFKSPDYGGPWEIVEGALTASNTETIKGNVSVGGSAATASFTQSTKNALYNNMNITVLTNGTFTAGDIDSGRVYSIHVKEGGKATVGYYFYAVKARLTGGTIQGGNFWNGGYTQEIRSDASPVPALFDCGFEFSTYFDVALPVGDGPPPVDLTITKNIRANSSSYNLTKSQAGTVRLTAASTLDMASFIISGGTVLADNDSGSATGKSAVKVNAGATLGGTGYIGGLSGYTKANVTASGTSGNNAVIAPGTMDTATGAHIFGALTIGSAAQTNNVTFGANSRLVVSIGKEEAVDQLVVQGMVDLSSTSDSLALTVDPEAKAGTYVLVSASGGVIGTFNTPDVPKPALLTYTATTVEYTVPPSATLIIVR